MKRSEINKMISAAKEMLAEFKQPLPPFAYWTLKDWQENAAAAAEITDCMLGWDVTDFGSGDFNKIGLFLFTLRNGNLGSDKYSKKYAQKYLIVRDRQVTPYHFHWSKAEDIINIGGGTLVVKLYNADEKEGLADTPVTVYSDGIKKQIPAGGIVRLKTGESITLKQYQYHSFWAEGDTILMEVSDVNDDKMDNRFYENQGRFPDIDEDEEILHKLVSDY